MRPSAMGRADEPKRALSSPATRTTKIGRASTRRRSTAGTAGRPAAQHRRVSNPSGQFLSAAEPGANPQPARYPHGASRNIARRPSMLGRRRRRRPPAADDQAGRSPAVPTVLASIQGAQRVGSARSLPARGSQPQARGCEALQSDDVSANPRIMPRVAFVATAAAGRR